MTLRHAAGAALLFFVSAVRGQSSPPSAATEPASAIAPTTQPATETQPATAPGLSLIPPESPTTLNKVIVTKQLDQLRINIAPELGATSYLFTPAQIANIPGGENAPFQQILLRAPGVVLDSFGAIHVRGEHANLTYRINGVLLPQPLESFAQELDPHLIQSLSLITGSLPAQFGFHTAGIVDVNTKSGASLEHNELSLYGGSFNTFKTSFQAGGTADRLDYFVTGSYNHSDLGLENPTRNYNAIHDTTDQQRLFGYFSYTLDDTSRLSLLLNAANGDYQIPNTPGLPPAFPLAGHSNTDSTKINENQNQQEYYSVLSYQKAFERFNMQLSLFSRYASINFRPDSVNDLIFQGVAGRVYNGFLTNGVQFDGAYMLSEDHTLRLGLIADYTCEKLSTNTGVFDTDAGGDPISDTARSIDDQSANNALEAGFYVQDEWRITPQLTLNYGFRYDRYDANFDHEGQISPRINAVLKLDDATTVHAGYARYFVPPPVQDVHALSLAKFANTTNAPENFTDDPPRVERSNYFDLGIAHDFNKDWHVSLDGFYKQAHNLLDLGQFGAPVILSPFNYRKGAVYGAELSTTYSHDGLSLFGNFSWVRASGFDPNSQQFLWANDELAYAQAHGVTLDHESEYTISAGVSYTWKDDRVYIDTTAGSGLRRGFANTQKEAVYYPVNIGYEHIFRLEGKQAVRCRVDVVNVFDQKYQLRDGSGVGVGAPQYGERIGIFAGVTYEF